MRKFLLSFGALLALFVSALQPIKAQTSINVSLGNTAPPFADGTKQSSLTYAAAVAGKSAPFDKFYGSDSAGPNFSESWTFGPYTPPSFTIYGATLTLGIWDIDSAAPGNQVFSFTLTGAPTDLTSLLNAASEGLNSNMGSPNSYYNVLTINIPGSDFFALEGSSATFNLTLQGPGLGTLGSTTYNGAGLVFSTLDIEAPELSSWMLFLTGMLCFGIKRILSKLA